MTKAIDVLNYLKETRFLLGETQYQKLLYYVQAWSLAWDGTPLFDDPIEAWKNGPVVRGCRHQTDSAAAPHSLTTAQKAKIDAVVDYYGTKTGKELADLTHTERPWRDARGNLNDGLPSTQAITHTSMKQEYSRQSLAGQGPSRPVDSDLLTDRKTVLRKAKTASTHWERTLDLLAQ